MKKKILFPFLLLGLLLTGCRAELENYNPVSETVVTSMALDQDSLNVDIGKDATLTAYVSGKGSPTVNWRAENSKYFTLTANGNNATIHGTASGTANVVAYAGGKSAVCAVTVNQEGGTLVVVTAISLSSQSSSLYVGGNFTLTANVTSTGGTPTIGFSTQKSGIISVSKQNNNTALVSALSVGDDVITVTAGQLYETCTVSVIEQPSGLSIKLNKNAMTLVEGSTDTLVATVNPSDSVVTWDSTDKTVATVDGNGKVTANKEGTATINATISKDEETKVASCVVTVTAKGGDDDYEEKIKSWSEKGHLYLHYLRTSDNNYDNWAVWIWQNYPNDLEGSLWGAGHDYDQKGIVPETYGHMTKEQCGGTGSEVYVDEYGIVVDIDLTKEDLLGGRNRQPSPLVSDWNNIAKTALGFLIVDQRYMDGTDNWVSEGESEIYIKKLGSKMPDGKESYLHVYCVEGNASNYTTSSGKQEFVNPTATDTTGNYRSKNDITNLKYDKWPNGVGTSTTFLDDRPGTGYQIFVPSFCDSDGDGFGDLQGIISKLDYLDNLGIDVLWLTPIQESNSYHGYDVTDYYKIDQRYGTLEDYQELLYKAHEKGMKVLMDMVINHTSKSNVLYKKSQMAVTEVVNGKTINYRDMYLWKYKGDSILEWDGVEAPKDNPYSPTHAANYVTKKVEDSDDWYRDGTSNYYYYGKFGSGMAELNYSCQATRDYMTDMCKYWLSFGLDGFRLDAVKHIYLLSELDPGYNYSGDFISYDATKKTVWNEQKVAYETLNNDYSYDRDLNVIFWKEFAGTLKSAYPNCFLVGENFDGWNERIAPFYEALDSQFDFSTYYHIHESTGSGIVAMGGDIKNTLDIYRNIRGNAINGAFTSNHDVARFINHAASTETTAHHVEVNSSNKEVALQRARWTGAITMLTPGVSWIYYGDEIGLSGNIKDKVADSTGKVYDDHGNNTDRWYRQPMRWGKVKGQDGVVDYTFGGVEILWDKYNQQLETVQEQLSSSSESLLQFFTALCHVKQDDRYPTYGYISNQWAEGSNQNVLCMQITDGTRTVNAFVNATGSTVNIDPLNQGTLLGGSKGSTGSSIAPYGFAVVIK